MFFRNTKTSIFQSQTTSVQHYAAMTNERTCFETKWRQYAATTNKRLTFRNWMAFRKPEDVCTTPRRDIDRTLGRTDPKASVRHYADRTLYISKPYGVPTTLQREVERGLDCSKLNGVRTTLHRVSIGRLTFQIHTRSVQHYVASMNGRFTIRN